MGKEGDIEVETEAILIENGIDFSDFEERVSYVLKDQSSVNFIA